MKHLHFDVETAGFYGAYWAFPAAGNCCDCGYQKKRV